jgi:uncharacterized DUF497 family protein
VGYIFEWDPKKAECNARKHRLAFDEASTVFGDPLALLMPDPDHSIGEKRYIVQSTKAPGGDLCRAATLDPTDLGEAGHPRGAEAL